MLLLTISALVLAVAALVISYPLVFGRLEPHQAPAPGGSEYSERDALLEALGELELSRQVGKISTADYDKHKLQLEKQYLKAAAAQKASKRKK